MQLRRFVGVLIIVLIIWVILAITPMIKPGFLPYFFEPECTNILFDANARQINVTNGNLNIEAQKVDIAIERNSNISIEAVSPIIFRDTTSPVLELDSGETEILFYMWSETISFSSATILVENATISITVNRGRSLFNLTSASVIEIVAYYNLTQSAIPVWLSDSATIRILSKGSDFTWLYVTPQDTLNFQQLLRIRLYDEEVKKFNLEFSSEIFEGNSSFEKLAMEDFEGNVESVETFTLRGRNAVSVKSCNLRSYIELATEDDDLRIKTAAQEIAGRLWIDEIPQPESQSETFLRYGIASLFSVMVIVLTIVLEKYIDPQKTIIPKKSKRPELGTHVDYVEGIQAYLFFPFGSNREDMNLEYHEKHLRKRLIVNLKTNPPSAYYLTPGSYGWQLIVQYPDRWVSEIIPFSRGLDQNFEFLKKWCNEKGYDLKPWVAEKKDLLENGRNQ